MEKNKGKKNKHNALNGVSGGNGNNEKENFSAKKKKLFGEVNADKSKILYLETGNYTNESIICQRE